MEQVSERERLVARFEELHRTLDADPDMGRWKALDIIDEMMYCTEQMQKLSQAEQAEEEDGLVRLSVLVNHDTAEALRGLRDENGITVTEAIRRAVSIAKFFYDQKREGRVIRTMNAKGRKVKEIDLL